MNTDELEEILGGGGETQRIEFKRPMDWNATTLAKDILALSNVQDGGYILVGIEDETLVRTGITEHQRETYQIEIMRDQMAAYADPHVNISVSFPTDRNAVQFAAIHIKEFDDVPVLCRRDSADTVAGTLYFRNRNRRIESARVSNSNDMRDVVTRAAIKLMRQLSGYGLRPEARPNEPLDAELEGL